MHILCCTLLIFSIIQSYYAEFKQPLEVVATQQEFEQLLQGINEDYGPKDEETTRYFFVRHGQTYGNVNRELDGQTLNRELTALGISQGKEIGKQFEAENLQFDLMITSPMVRAQTTGQYILDELSHKPQTVLIDARVTERHSGKHEGGIKDAAYIAYEKEQEELIEKLPSFWDKFVFKPDPNDLKEENLQVLFERVVNMIEEHKTNPNIKGKTILVVTHAHFTKALFISAIAKQFHKDLEFYRFLTANGSFFVLDVKGNDFKPVRVQGYSYRPKS